LYPIADFYQYRHMHLPGFARFFWCGGGRFRDVRAAVFFRPFEGDERFSAKGFLEDKIALGDGPARARAFRSVPGRRADAYINGAYALFDWRKAQHPDTFQSFQKKTAARRPPFSYF
jgi:hypothetical protein